MKKNNRKKQIKLAAILTSVLLLLGGIVCLPAAESSFADQTVQEDSVVLSNEEGQQLQVNVEEELSAEEMEQQASRGLTGATDLEDSSVPLAGFDPAVMNGDEDGDIHLGWMIALLVVALAYVIYFTRYQSRIFDLRRKIASAESELRKGGRL